MQEAYPFIGGVPTHILTWGKWIEESFGDDEKEVVICITGNPGLPGFYTQFLSTVHNTLNEDIPVWVLGHAGHDEADESPFNQKVPALKGNEHLFDLKGQIQHKIDFIRKYVPKNVKIHLLGHSIGAYMVLELLKLPEMKEKIQHCYFLFPTIERMAKSSNGFILTRLVQPIFFILRLFYSLFYKLPVSVKILVLWIYFFFTSIPRYFVGTGLKYSKPEVIEKCWFLALDEMKKVQEVDIETIKANKEIIKLYYGASDGWVPKKYYHELKERIPDVDAELCTRKFAHAFVLRTPVEMGLMVGEWVLKNRTI